MQISRLVQKNDRRYLEYKGKPQLFYGVQLKLGDLEKTDLNPEEMEREVENHFKIAAACRFPIVCVPIYWKKQVEPARTAGTDCEFVKKCLGYCDRYGLSIHWLWFGSDVCGTQGNVPQDIWEDAKTYPRYKENGETLLEVDCPAFIEREKAALQYLLTILERLDVNHRTSAIQIENEPDFGAWHTQRARRQRVISELGKTVKQGDFKIITRVNLIAPRTYLGEDPVLDEILDMEGIDCVGVDVYVNEVQYCRDFTDYMNKRARGKNLPHFAEMGAHVDTLPQLICDTLQRGGGVLLYELKTAIRYSNGSFDFGLFRFSPNEWIERDGTVPVQYQWTEGVTVPESNTADIITLNAILELLNEPLATVPVSHIAMIMSGEERSFPDIKISFKTEETGPNAFGMSVLGEDGYLYCFTLANGVFKSDDLTAEGVEVFEDNSWKSIGKFDINLVVKHGFVYRISIKK